MISKFAFKKMEPSELGKLTLKEARPLLRKMRAEYNKQASVFKKHENNVWSPALQKMEEYYTEPGNGVAVSKMRLSKVQSELFRLQDFFNARTSTVKGSRDVMREQDARIFGVDEESGKPTRRLTLAQRTDLWAAYNEFTSMEKEQYVRNMGSNTIQTVLAGMIIEKGKREPFAFQYGDLKELKRRIEDMKEQEDWESANYDRFNNSVLSGKRPSKRR